MKFLNIPLVLALCSFIYAHPPPIGNEDAPPNGKCNRDYQCPAAADGHIPCCSFNGECLDTEEACKYGCQGGTNCQLEPKTLEEQRLYICYTTWRDNRCDDYCFCREGTGSCVDGYCVKDAKDDTKKDDISSEKYKPQSVDNDNTDDKKDDKQDDKIDDKTNDKTDDKPDDKKDDKKKDTEISTPTTTPQSTTIINDTTPIAVPEGDEDNNTSDSTINNNINNTNTDSTGVTDNNQQNTDDTTTVGSIGNTKNPGNAGSNDAPIEESSATVTKKGLSIIVSLILIYFF